MPYVNGCRPSGSADAVASSAAGGERFFVFSTGFRVKDLGFRVKDLGLGFRISDLGV